MSSFSHLDAATRRALRRAGIPSEPGALEVLSRCSGFCLPGGDRRALIMALEASVGGETVHQIRRHSPPPMSLGVAGPRAARHRVTAVGDGTASGVGAEAAIGLLSGIEGSLPEQFSLLDYISPVRQQGPHGTCVGQAVTAGLEFFFRLPRRHSGLRQLRGPGTTRLSAKCTYLLAKQRDGDPSEGTWQEFAWQAAMEYGCVPEAVLPYDMTTASFNEGRHARAAARYRIRGYMDLLLPSSLMDWQPTLMRMMLAGQAPGLGPQPIGVSVAVTESFGYLMAQETGRIVVLKDALILGGHAMLCVGYFWDPEIEQYTFILLNSWGQDWAARSPVHPGCALVPAEYFKDPELTWELFTPLTHPSPASPLGWLGAFMRRGWDSRSLALD